MISKADETIYNAALRIQKEKNIPLQEAIRSAQIAIDNKRCLKCREQLPKKVKRIELTDYTSEPRLCFNCNAVAAIINRFNKGMVFELEELCKFPKCIMFSDDERKYADKLQNLLNSVFGELYNGHEPGE